MKPAHIDPISTSYYSPGHQRDAIYVPVDPFAPSIAFSLNNYLPRVFRRKSTENQTELPQPPPAALPVVSGIRYNHSALPVLVPQEAHSTSPGLFGPRSEASLSSVSSQAIQQSESRVSGDTIDSIGSNRTSSAVGNDWETQGANEPSYTPHPQASSAGTPVWTYPLPNAYRSNQKRSQHEPARARPAWRTVHPRPTRRPAQMEVPWNIPAPSPLPNIPTNTAGYALALAFLLDTVPRQVYLHLHLRLPYLYYSRVTRIFEEAEMSVPTIIKGILQAAAEKDADVIQRQFQQRAVPLEPPSENAAYTRLKDTWESFIDSLVKEWKTLNIISVLLLS